MHIPDGFVDARTAVASGVLAVGGLSLAMRQVKRRLAPARLPLVGLAAAFVFAAQMLNFPIPGGTSGHLMGGTLAAVLLGPSAAVLVMGSVLILQALLFNDGGLTALGANFFNLAMVGPVVGYLAYVAVRKTLGNGLRTQLLATAFAAWISTVAAAVSCAGQLALSGVAAWNLVLPAMALLHMVIGLGEALITTLVIAAVARARPELLSEQAQPNLQPQAGELLVQGVVLCAGLVVFVAPFASSLPDGLEKVAGALGFEGRAAAPVMPSPMPDYAIPGMDSPILATVITGLIGTVVAFVLAYLLARWLAPSKGQPQASPIP